MISQYASFQTQFRGIGVGQKMGESSLKSGHERKCGGGKLRKWNEKGGLYREHESGEGGGGGGGGNIIASACFSMSFIFVLFMLHLLTVCALYVCLCDYVNICMYLVLLCIFGKKLLRACVYCYTKTEFK